MQMISRSEFVVMYVYNYDGVLWRPIKGIRTTNSTVWERLTTQQNDKSKLKVRIKLTQKERQ